jgi:DNA-binding CsgD family transcriptional regulator
MYSPSTLLNNARGELEFTVDALVSGSPEDESPRIRHSYFGVVDQSRLMHLERAGALWTLVDDGLSRNGSFVNGERLRGRRRLVDGDELRFGDTIVVFRAPLPVFEETVPAEGTSEPVRISEAQRRVLVALCRPFRDGQAFATPASNQQIAAELFLSPDAVKTHMRALFQRLDVEDLPQNKKRARLVELAFARGVIAARDLDDD